MRTQDLRQLFFHTPGKALLEPLFHGRVGDYNQGGANKLACDSNCSASFLIELLSSGSQKKCACIENRAFSIHIMAKSNI